MISEIRYLTLNKDMFEWFKEYEVIEKGKIKYRINTDRNWVINLSNWEFKGK